MKRIFTNHSFIRLSLTLALLAAQFGCANTKPATLYYIQQDVGDVEIEQPKDGLNQKKFDQKIAEIRAKAKGNTQILNTVDSLYIEQAKYCDKRNDVEFFTASLLFSASLFGHYFWYRSIRNKYQNEAVTEQGGMAALGDGIIWTTSFAISLPLEFFIFPKLLSRAVVGPRVKAEIEKEMRKTIRVHNRYVSAMRDSLKNN